MVLIKINSFGEFLNFQVTNNFFNLTELRRVYFCWYSPIEIGCVPQNKSS